MWVHKQALGQGLPFSAQKTMEDLILPAWTGQTAIGIKRKASQGSAVRPLFHVEQSQKVLNLDSEKKGDAVPVPLREVLSPATLLSPGTEQANATEAELRRETSLSLETPPPLSVMPRRRAEGLRLAPGRCAHMHTMTHLCTKSLCGITLQMFTPGSSKCHDKLLHVHVGQKAEYQMTEIAPSPSLSIVFL